MAARLQSVSRATLLIVLLASGPGALAQASRPWVDPPVDMGAPSQTPAQTPAQAPAQPPAPRAEPAPEPHSQQSPTQEAPSAKAAPAPQPAPPSQPPQPASPIQSAQPAKPAPAAPPQGGKRDARAKAARDLTVRYLNSWSAPNTDALDATGDFYAPRVLFHGREMNVRALQREKRRFVRRWPERQYSPRKDTIQVACDDEGNACSVQSLFDFTAANPRRDRQAQGVGALQLIVSFVDGQPVISAESSIVLNRTGSEDDPSPEDNTDD